MNPQASGPEASSADPIERTTKYGHYRANTRRWAVGYAIRTAAQPSWPAVSRSRWSARGARLASLPLSEAGSQAGPRNRCPAALRGRSGSSGPCQLAPGRRLRPAARRILRRSTGQAKARGIARKLRSEMERFYRPERPASERQPLTWGNVVVAPAQRPRLSVRRPWRPRPFWLPATPRSAVANTRRSDAPPLVPDRRKRHE